MIVEEKNKRRSQPNRRLRAAREQRGWSQRALANMLGTSELTVGRWERGERSPQLFYRAKLCEVFEMTADELGLVEAEVSGEMASGQTFSGKRTVELALPGSPSPLSFVLSALSKMQKRWPGRMVLVALAVLSILGGIGGLSMTNPFTAFSRSAPPRANSLVATQSSTQSWVTPTSTPLLTDPLTQPIPLNHWGTGHVCSFAGGGYHARSIGVNYCLKDDVQLSDFVYQIRVTIQQGTESGIIFRGAWNSHLYYFYVDTSGHYGLEVVNHPMPHRALLGGFSSGILRGTNQSNLLAVEARGNTLRLFVNRSLVGQVQDMTYIQGYVGVCVGNYDDLAEDKLTLTSFRDASIWDLGG